MPTIYVNYGTDLARMAGELLEGAHVADRLDAGMRAAIKPNLVVARPAAGGATTHPEIIEGIICYLRDHGIREIFIIEGSWVGDDTKRAFQTCGYAALADRYGVRLVDTKSSPSVRLEAHGMQLAVCRVALETDFLINVPVLKGHCQTQLTCCLKNLKGIIPDAEKRKYHTMGLHKPIAALNTLVHPALHVVDGICGDPTFEEGGNPVECGRMMLGFDPVALDSYGAALLGLDPGGIGYLKLARDHGVGVFADESTEIIELNAAHRPKTDIPRGSLVRRLAGSIREDSACSACYAALVCALNQTAWQGAPIHIGQGWRGKAVDGVGVGNCAAGCTRHAPGCPPTALGIVDFLGSI
jgi:uncharacterized protein (DUF362 family)